MVTSNVQLVRPLGEGGMGSVWIAEHTALHTQVVVKFIAADYATHSEALARFSREAAAASQVKSPHVVQTLDHGVTPDGIPYIVMEHLEGRDLETHLSEVGVMTPREVVEIVTQLSRALEKAHAAGIVHRDIKPSNIFLCDAGDGGVFVKLLDFGIAKGANVPKLDNGTRTGAMMGSPYYMSPEQVVAAKDIDFRTDLWSVGVVVFEALTGRRPFEAETVGALAIKIHTEALPLPSEKNPNLPTSVDAWFSRACARAPQDRFASAKELAEQLQLALTGDARAAISLVPSTRRSNIALAETAVAATTDPRAATDAGLGVQTTSRKATSRTARGVLIAAAVVVVGFTVGIGVIKARNIAPDASTSGMVLPADNTKPNTTVTATASTASTSANVPLPPTAATSAAVSATAAATTTGKRVGTSTAVRPSAAPSSSGPPTVTTPPIPTPSKSNDIF
jgi:serine/threonine-protein kinase